jgi:predicted ATP-grasp superfamily ATP-dependent carboligase
MQKSLDNSARGALQNAPLASENMAEIQPARRYMEHDALILDAQLRQSLVTVRSLGQRGMHVAALEISSLLKKAGHVPTFSSRWCQRGYVAPSYEGHNTGPFLLYLLQLLDYTNARVLIASSDGTLALIREHRETLEQRVRIALAKEPALSVAINKDQTLEIAERLGLGVPRSAMLEAASEVSAALREVGLPAVVKPIESWLWGENGQPAVRLICQLVTTPEEARKAVAELTSYGGKVLFQQFLSGSRESISFLYAKGEVYARFAQWARRTQPPLGGTSVYRQSISLPEDIACQAERLVRAIELEGYSEIEFRRDRAGKAYLMEINPRLSASVEVAVRAGVDFPYLLYQWASGERISRVESYRTGVWMRYLGGDILTTIQALHQRGRPGVDPPLRAILDFCLSFCTPAGYDYVEWRDPLPALVATAGFLHHHAGRLLTRN